MKKTYFGIVVVALVLALFILSGCVQYPVSPGGAKPMAASGSGYGPVSKSVDTSGTETWQVTFSGTESYDSKYNDGEGTTTVSSLSKNMQGSFPVTISREVEENGFHYTSADIDAGYPVSGTVKTADHITDTKGMKEDREAEGSYTTSDFQMDISPDGSWSVDITSHTTKTGSDKLVEPRGYRGTDYPGFSENTPVSEDGTAEFACNSDQSGEGTRDFHKSGAAYIINCQEPEDNPSLGQTGQISFKLTMDPEYVQPTTGDILAPLVTPTDEPIASLVPPS